VTGAPKISLVEDLIEAMVAKDLSKSLSILNEVSKANLDMQMFAKILIETLRSILLLKVSVGAAVELKDKLAEARFNFIKKISEMKDSPIKADTLREFLIAYEQMGMSYIPELPLELSIIKILEVSG